MTIQSVVGTSITLTLDAAAGRTYRVQTGVSLAAGSWTTEQTINPVTTDQTLHPVINAAPGTTRLFVRMLAP